MAKASMSCFVCVVLMTSFVALSSVITVAEGKCRGRWSIHACWGGNGKRSGNLASPNEAKDVDDTSETINILRRLLLRETPLMYNNNNNPAVEDTILLKSLLPEDFPSPSSSSLSSSLSSKSSPSSLPLSSKKRFPDEEGGAEPFASSHVGGDRLAALKRLLRTLEQQA